MSAMAAAAVLMTAALWARRISWRKAHVWMVYVSAMMLLTFVVTHLGSIDRPWLFFLTVAFVVKSMSMLAMLLDKSRNNAVAGVEVSIDGTERGNGLLALGGLCRSLSAGVHAGLVVGAEAQPPVEGRGGAPSSQNHAAKP